MRLYSFKEKSLGNNFASEKVKQFKNWIEQSSSFCLLSIPGVGVTNFLRYFASTQKGYFFIFVDAFSLASPTKKDFFCQILKEIGVSIPNTEQEILERCRSELEYLCQKENVVLIFNRFNQLSDIFDFQFFSNIRWLQITNRDQIRIICTSNRPLPDINPQAVGGSNLNLFSTIHHFGFYLPTDLKKLVPTATPEAINLSGGHIQLLQLILKAEPGALSQDPFIKLQFKAILEGVSPSLRKQLIKSPFTPLLIDYLNITKGNKLPHREAKLFKLLNANLGEIVSKETIFESVWEDNWEDASDWALNSLVYRLRKHPIMQNYSIENYKKLGYRLSSGTTEKSR
jgi:hypothetical protein